MDRMNRAQIEAGRDRWQALTALRRYALGTTLARLRCPVLRLTGEHFYFRHMEPEFRKRVKHLQSEVLADTRFCACWKRANEIAARTIAFAQAA